MRAKTLFFAILFTALAGIASGAAKEQAYKPVDPAEWLASHFKQGGIPPFSFKYDGKDSESFIRNWTYGHKEKQLDANRIQHIYTYTAPETKLRIRAEAIVYKDFAAVEWVFNIKNESDATSPIIEDFQALDTVFSSATSSRFMLHHAFGSDVTRQDFAPMNTPLRSVDTISFKPNGGRPSDIEAFPFFNLEAQPYGGTMIAIGWTGQWAATFSRIDTMKERVRAGMATMHLRLYAQEEIRTPRILLMFWDGEDYMKGQNTFRKLILAHYTPQKDGKTVRLPFAFSVHGTYVFNDTTGKNMVELAAAAAKKFKNIGFEYFWIDAGWYKGGWPNGVGNFFADPERYPNGLAPVGKAAAENGYKFLLWIEPERVKANTQFFTEHPKWVLKNYRDLDTGLYDLSNPKAREWLTDKISEILDTGGVSIYRQDFNMDPIMFWKTADKPNRIGMTEIRYVEGLYKFWDDLVARHPGLVIDNCASGGRRIDLETVSRAVMLWRTDYTDGSDPAMPDGLQSHTYSLNFWLPTASTGTGTHDKYHFRSTMTNGMVVSWNPLSTDLPIEKLESFAAEFKRAREYYYGDYYPLTGYSTELNVWMAFQFHREDLRSGMVLAFRRKDNRDPQLRVQLKGLSPDAKYELDYSGKNIKKTMTGKELMDSLIITLDNPRDSELIFYKQM